LEKIWGRERIVAANAPVLRVVRVANCWVLNVELKERLIGHSKHIWWRDTILTDMIIVARRIRVYENTGYWTNKRGIEKSHKELSAVKLAVGLDFMSRCFCFYTWADTGVGANVIGLGAGKGLHVL
jgi:hypothetical protein